MPISQSNLYYHGVGLCCMQQACLGSSTSFFNYTQEYRASSGILLSFSECVLKCTDNAVLSKAFASFIQVVTLFTQFLMQ